jgi:hypothetical protein
MVKFKQKGEQNLWKLKTPYQVKLDLRKDIIMRMNFECFLNVYFS